MYFDKIRNLIDRILQGSALDVLKTIPDNSVDTIIKSPPYWNLRDYKVKGQLGLESSFERYLDSLFEIEEESRRILKPTGTIVTNIGDTRAGNKTGNTNGTMGNVVQKDGINSMDVRKRVGSVRAGLIGIPQRYVIGMVDRGWYWQEKPIWWKRNAMPSSRRGFTVDYEDVFVFSKNCDPLFYINGNAKPNFRFKPPTYDEGAENVDWTWKKVSEKRLARYKDKPLPRHWTKREDGTVWMKRTLWEAIAYHFAIQYRPYAESTIKELTDRVDNWESKYDGSEVQGGVGLKGRVLSGIKFGGNKADGYGPNTYSGKEWTPKVVREYRVATRPGLDTGNGKSGTEDDPNAGLHNSTLSTKREQIIREIDGVSHGSLMRCVWRDDEYILVKVENSVANSSVLDITTKGYPEAHFATFPETLIEPLINALCPEWVCLNCGIPREPIYEPTEEYAKLLGKGWHDHSDDEEQGMMQEKELPSARADYKIVGLSDCGCNAGFTGGIVLDPFFGSGTVGVVALKHGRHYIGIELNPSYVEMAKRRLKPYQETQRLT